MSEDSQYLDDMVALGKTVKNARKEYGLTVEQLAARANVSTGSLSQIERGQANPSYVTLHRLADALGLSLQRLLQRRESTEFSVVRKTDRTLIPNSAWEEELGLVRERLTSNLRGPLQVIRSIIPAGFSNEGQPFRHLGQECVTVLSNALTVVVGKHEIVLERGDSMTYNTAIAHYWHNHTDESTEVFGAVTPLSF